MKKILLTILAIYFSGLTYAQKDNMSIHNAGISNKFPVVIGFGTRIGANYATLTGDGSENYKPVVGIVVGGAMDFQFKRWYSVSLDVLFSSQGYMLKGTSGTQGKEILSHTIIPVTSNFIIKDKFKLKVGLQPSFLVGAVKFTDDKPKQWNINSWNRFDLAIPLGASYSIPWRGLNWEFDIRYIFGILDINPAKDITNRSSVISFSMAIKF